MDKEVYVVTLYFSRPPTYQANAEASSKDEAISIVKNIARIEGLGRPTRAVAKLKEK